MSGSSISTDALRGGAGGGSDPSGSSRRRRLALWLAGIGVLAVVALVAAATIPGSHSAPKPFSTLAVAPHGSGANQLRTHETSVFDSNIPARDYGTRISQLENGIGADGQIASDLDPIPARAFNGPVAGYIHYAVGVSDQLGTAVSALTAQLQAGDRAAAERAWDVAFTDYLHLGAVYGLLPGNLNDHLAQVPSSLTQTAFHRAAPRSRRGCGRGRRCARSCRSPRPSAPRWCRSSTRYRRTEIDPLDYSARAHEILEDAQRDLMCGTEVPWSGDGVLGTAAGVAATHEVVRTLAPLMQGRDNTLVQVDNWLLRLQSVMDSRPSARRQLPDAHAAHHRSARAHQRQPRRRSDGAGGHPAPRPRPSVPPPSRPSPARSTRSEPVDRRSFLKGSLTALGAGGAGAAVGLAAADRAHAAPAPDLATATRDLDARELSQRIPFDGLSPERDPHPNAGTGHGHRARQRRAEPDRAVRGSSGHLLRGPAPHPGRAGRCGRDR